MRLKEIRVEKKVTQQTIAERMDVKQNTVSQWEAGIRHPRADMLPKLAEVLGCSIDELYRK